MRLDFVPGVRRVAALTSEHCGAGCRVQGTECRGAGWRGRGGALDPGGVPMVGPWAARRTHLVRETRLSRRRAERRAAGRASGRASSPAFATVFSRDRICDESLRHLL